MVSKFLKELRYQRKFTKAYGSNILELMVEKIRKKRGL
jgi:hypothetical protein